MEKEKKRRWRMIVVGGGGGGMEGGEWRMAVGGRWKWRDGLREVDGGGWSGGRRRERWREEEGPKA